LSREPTRPRPSPMATGRELALLQLKKKALRAGYKSYKSAGVFGHFAETKGGLLPDAA